MSPQCAAIHKSIELPKGTYSGLNENFGKTFLVLFVLKNVELISYDSARDVPS